MVASVSLSKSTICVLLASTNQSAARFPPSAPSDVNKERDKASFVDMLPAGYLAFAKVHPPMFDLQHLDVMKSPPFIQNATQQNKGQRLFPPYQHHVPSLIAANISHKYFGTYPLIWLPLVNQLAHMILDKIPAVYAFCVPSSNLREMPFGSLPEAYIYKSQIAGIISLRGDHVQLIYSGFQLLVLEFGDVTDHDASLIHSILEDYVCTNSFIDTEVITLKQWVPRKFVSGVNFHNLEDKVGPHGVDNDTLHVAWVQCLLAKMLHNTGIIGDTETFEVEPLGKIWHESLVRPSCYCNSGNIKLSEYIPHQSLIHWLTGYQFVIDAVEGLLYWHHDCTPLIVHRGVKINMWDGDFVAIVEDFGLPSISPKEAKRQNTCLGLREFFATLNR